MVMVGKKLAFVVAIIFCFMVNINILSSGAETGVKVAFMYEEKEDIMNFTALIDASNYTWDFGDGTVAYGKYVSHIYASPGIYTVKLTVKKGDDIETYTQNITTDNIPPTADFYYSPEYPYTLVTIFFFDNSSDSDGDIINWTWDFGDGSISYERNPTHVFTKAGKYNVTLTVVDNDFEASHVTKQVIVRNREPVAKFYWTREENIIRFHANYPYDPSYDPDGSIVNYTWDFGDGSKGYGSWVEHEYVADKLYNVTLTVIDDDGGIATFTRQIHSYNKLPVMEFEYTPSEPTDLDNITFKSKCYDSDGSIVNYTWDFGDGSKGYNETEVHRYSDDGHYTVWLWAIDNEGAFNATQETIHVRNVPPVANFTWEPLYPFPGKNITFNASLSYDLDGDIVVWQWDFGDGSVSEGMIVNHSYSGNGFYNVTLTVTDDDGAKTNVTKTLFIADFYVDENVYDPANHTWNKIQDAIDNATDGALIFVRKGTYYEDVVVDKSVRLLADGAKLIGENISFLILADDVIIENFAVENAVRGIVIEGNDAHILNCSFKNHEIAITINGSSNILEEVVAMASNASLIINGEENAVGNGSFHGNLYGCKLKGKYNEITFSAFSGLYGVYVGEEENSIYNNYVTNSIYGIYVAKESLIENNTIEGCSFGLYSATNFILYYNKFIDNTYGIKSSVSFTIDSSYFLNNQIGISGEVEAYNILIYGGEKGLSIDKGMIKDSIIEGADTGVDVTQNVSLQNITIRGCNEGIGGGGVAEIMGGIFEENGVGVAVNATIINSSFVRNQWGIKSLNFATYNSTFEENGYGVLCMETGSVINSTFAKNEIGIDVKEGSCIIYGNVLTGNDFAILIESQHNSIRNNMIENNTYGIRIMFASNNIMAENYMENNTYNFDIEGSQIEHFYQQIDTSNMINGKEMLYLINSSDFEINGGYGYLALINCSNIIVTNIDISYNGEGILIVFSRNITCINCSFSKNIDGAYVLNAENINLENVAASENNDGVSFKSSHRISIKNSSFSGNSRAINLFYMEKEQAEGAISGSTLSNNQLGINVENLMGLEIENTSFTNNEKAMRIFNAEVEINGCVSNDSLGIDAVYGNIVINNMLFLSNVGIQLFSSNAYLNSITINGSATGIAGKNSFVEIFNSTFIYAQQAISIENCTIHIFNTTFMKNDYAVKCSTGYAIVNKSKFTDNEYGIYMEKGNGSILNGLFSSNECGIYINSSKANIVNATVYENNHGVTLSSSLCKIEGGVYYNNSVAIEVYGNNNSINEILFHHNGKAVIIEGEENEVINSSFWKNLYGVVAYGEDNTIYHNNFVYNVENAIDYGENIWNISYPIGGNYWFDYAGEDHYMGKRQNESGSDGIGDIPHEIYGGFDYYPLMDYATNAATIPNEVPIADFYFYPSSPYSLEEITFIDTSYDENGYSDIVAWLWDFGDGNISHDKNPKHVYEKAGMYNVTLTITDKAGANSSITKQIIIANNPPIVNFTWQPQQPLSYTLIDFNASGSYDLDGFITNYTWDFGDGSVAYGEVVTHKYAKAGTYKVILKVTDNEGQEGAIEKIIEVENRPPEVTFIFTPEEAKVGEEINFTDLSSDLDGEIVEWRWDFGDGTIVYGKDVSHKYNEAGEYTVTLYVKDNEGAKANYSMKVKVVEKETPGFGIIAIFIALAIVAMTTRRLKKFK